MFVGDIPDPTIEGGAVNPAYEAYTKKLGAAKDHVNDYWSSIIFDLCVCIPLLFAGFLLVFKGARMKKTFHFLVGFVGMFIVLGQSPIWMAKLASKMNIERGTVWVDMCFLLIPCLIAGLIMAYFQKFVTFAAGCVGGWFLAGFALHWIGDFQKNKDDVDGGNVMWYVVAIAITALCGLLAVCLADKIARMLLCTVATSLTVSSLGEILVCVALFVIKMEQLWVPVDMGLKNSKGLPKASYDSLSGPTAPIQQEQFIDHIFPAHTITSVGKDVPEGQSPDAKFTFTRIFHPRLFLPFNAFRELPAIVAHYKQKGLDETNGSYLIKNYYAEAKFKNDWFAWLILAVIFAGVYFVAHWRFNVEAAKIEAEEEMESDEDVERGSRRTSLAHGAHGSQYQSAQQPTYRAQQQNGFQNPRLANNGGVVMA